jgi:LPXTG-site transpeptidase (sortase) family protein
MRYSDLGDLWLEIPSLGVELPIVGVPLTADGWDVTWLARQAGWLNGTAFPTWEGNSVLTAHVTLASGRAGPFRSLGNLRFDNSIVVHYAGQRYVYSVRRTAYVQPDDPSIFRHEDRAWLTLLTCQGFDPARGEYRSRIIVRAVLTSIEPEP